MKIQQPISARGVFEQGFDRDRYRWLKMETERPQYLL